MNLSNSELDKLFEEVRNEKPVASFDETQRAFLAGTIAAAGGVLATKSLLKIFTFKQWIMMISVLSAATVGTLLVTMSNSPVKVDKKHVAPTEMPKKEITVTETIPEKQAEETNPELVVAPISPIQTFKAKLEEVLQPEKGAVYARKKQPVQLVAYRMDDGSYKFVYNITPYTSEAELLKMQKEAKDAGFDLTYDANFNQETKKLERLSLQIIQEEESGQTQNVQISNIELKEGSEYRIAWNVDDEGAATTIAYGENFRQNEVDQLLAELNLEELMAELESLKSLSELEEMAVLSELENVQFESMELALVEAEKVLEDKEMRASLMEMEGINEEVLEEAREGLREAREELEEHRREFEEECEQMREECEERSKRCKEGSGKVRAELVKDGLIKDNEKSVRMKCKKGKISVNGNEIPRNLRNKYKSLIHEYFDIDTDQNGLTWTWEHTDD